MTRRLSSTPITPLQFGNILDEAKKIDPKIPVKLIVKLSPYDKSTIQLMENGGFELEFEMPLQNKICGKIQANKGKIVKDLLKQKRVTYVEVCDLTSVETV